jgi:hypothetical protein
MQSVMWVVSTQLCELLPLYPSLWFTYPPPLCQSTVYTDSEWLGWGVLSPVGDHILQDQILYKIATPPQTIT